MSIPVYSEEEDKRVLFISSYSASFPSIPEQIQGIQSIFDENGVLFDIEFMDTKRLYTEENYANFYQSIAYKMAELDPYDLVLVGDDNGLQFVMDYQEELFEDMPIIFFAVNSLERAELASSNEMISGVVEALSIEDTIDVALSIHPKADEIIAIVDNTTTGMAGLGVFNDLANDYENIDFNYINSEEHTYAQIGEMLGEVNDTTIILYLAMFSDKEGNSNSIYDSARMLREMSPVPVYLPYSNGVGQGFFGGKVVYHYEQGRLAAHMALDVLQGRSVDEIELVSESPNQYFFDYELLEFFGLNEKLFPEESLFVNKEDTFYQMYANFIWTVLGIIATLIAGILVLLINIKKRKASEVELIAANTELTALTEELIAQEEELHSKYDELTESQKALKQSQERYSLVFKASAEGLWDYNYETDVTYMSGDWHNLYIREKSLHKWKEQIYEDDHPYYMNVIDGVKRYRKETYACEYRVYDIKGSIKWIHEKGVTTFNEEGQLLRIVGSHVDVTRRKEQDEMIKELAYFDHLTGLPNRASLYQDAEYLFGYNNNHDYAGAVIFMDVDNFKFINDTYGHSIGDLVVKEIGLRIRKSNDDNAIVYRLGGDEFVIILEEDSRSKSTEKMIIDIQTLISKPFLIEEYTFNMTVSIGVAMYPENGLSIEDLLKNADTAMYKAKEEGRNRFKYFESSMNQEIYDRMQIQNNIRNALIKDEFRLFYQPIVNVETGKIVGFEALLRWFSESNGLIPPDQFIYVAEQMGIIVPIGYWVFETACLFAREINRHSNKTKIITVNISPVQLIQDSFVQEIENIMKLTKVDPQMLGLEITETALMESFEENQIKLKKLQEIGFKIYLDDFGTGYSSLNYLRALPIDTIKIDKSFIDDVASETYGHNLSEDIILIAHKLGLTVIAEGVERKDQLEKLKEINCDRVQGYLFSKPVAPNVVMKLLDEEL